MRTRSKLALIVPLAALTGSLLLAPAEALAGELSVLGDEISYRDNTSGGSLFETSTVSVSVGVDEDDLVFNGSSFTVDPNDVGTGDGQCSEGGTCHGFNDGSTSLDIKMFGFDDHVTIADDVNSGIESWVSGGDGDDELEGGGSSDRITGEGGTDTITGGGNNDILEGSISFVPQTGNTIQAVYTANDGGNTISGGTGADVIRGAGDVDDLE